MPHVMHIDIETYSSAPLPKCGVYRYVDAPDFEILLFSYAIDDGPVQTIDMACGEKLPPDVLAALDDPAILKLAHNAAFERVCLSRYLGYWLDPAQWRCSMVMASYLTLPMRLADVAVALNLTEKKIEEGKDLIRYFSIPCKATKTNGGRTRNLPEHAPDKWAVYKSYNAQDVETERAVVKALEKHPLPEHEWALYALDQRINDRGVRVDKLLVKQAMSVDQVFSAQAFLRAKQLTGLDNPGSVSQLKAWLADQDMPMESLAKRIVQQKAKDAGGIVGELLNLRLELSKTSVKKYEAMARTVCRDGRIHGLLQFGGASRTMRWAGRLVQAQNLPQNHLPDLSLAREIVKAGDEELLELLFGSVPGTLSELIRTAFIPKDGCRFIVADFSAIEARVLAWLADEEWVLDEFRGRGKIYEATAARMFAVPAETIVKGNPNYEYRQKGKQATLSCIAEGQLVLTNHGLVPIEQVRRTHRVWDGEAWVRHGGVVYRGRREVITYDGLTATPEHLVWIEGQSRPVQFGVAAASGARLAVAECRGKAVWLGEDHQCREAVEREMESVLCADRVYFVPQHPMDQSEQSNARYIQGLPELLGETQANTNMAGSEADRRQASMRKPARQPVQTLWRSRDTVQLSVCDQSGHLDSGKRTKRAPRLRDGSDQQRRPLRAGEHTFCVSFRQFWESTADRALGMGSAVLALLPKCGYAHAIGVQNSRGDHRISTTGCARKTKRLENDQRTARLYDIRNAGPHHRFTVSGHLVHNCGFGGGVGALKAMNAKMPEEEMQPLVDAWRAANPHIVAFWGALDRAAHDVIEEHTSARVGKVTLFWRDERIFIQLPGGRRLCYISPRFVPNRFGGNGIGYLAPAANGQLVVQETFGGKLAENCLARGTPVITDRGVVPIEEITTSHLIWDGEDFVTHDGVIAQGIQPTICVNGLCMTREHQILTKKGWLPCGKCDGLGWETVSLPDSIAPCAIDRNWRDNDAVPTGSRVAAPITVCETGSQELVYDIRNCGPRHRFALWDGGSARIVSNCIQSIARDLLAHGMMNLEAAGYPIVFHVHDEAVMEVPIGQGSVEEACEIMARAPDWAEGLPLRADGEALDFYRK